MIYIFKFILLMMLMFLSMATYQSMVDYVDNQEKISDVFVNLLLAIVLVIFIMLV